MISYLPELYPDELVYSWFCRLYIHGGYLTHKAALTDLFEKRSCNPSKEFIGYLNAEAKKTISNVIPINKLVTDHTMFPQYARFLPSDEKLAALRPLGEGSTDPHHVFTILIRNPNSEWINEELISPSAVVGCFNHIPSCCDPMTEELVGNMKKVLALATVKELLRQGRIEEILIDAQALAATVEIENELEKLKDLLPMVERTKDPSTDEIEEALAEKYKPCKTYTDLLSNIFASNFVL